MKIAYINKRFSSASLSMIETANTIVEDYQQQGFSLTLRQLYYQFVSRGLIPNSQSEYKKLGSVVNDARLAGMIDWEAIEDRTRNMRKNSHWRSPRGILISVADQYAIDKRETQDSYIEVWIEKDALVGLLEGVCSQHDVPYFSCRGYTSQSEMWSAAMRMKDKCAEGKECIILHLGDHDPSGLDMSRDIEERIRMFMEDDASLFSLERLALNMDQVKRYSPPPNPAKSTDTRFDFYKKQFGDESWELDALDPSVIVDLIDTRITQLTDDQKYHDRLEEENKSKVDLSYLSAHYDRIVKRMRE
jgi:hypothetical protein